MHSSICFNYINYYRRKLTCNCISTKTNELHFLPDFICVKVVDDNTVFMKVKTWAELLNTFCTSGKLELELMYKVQMQCYEDAKLMKLFPEIVRSLYDQDVLAEDTILHWFRKGTNTKGRYENFLRTRILLKIVIYTL